MDPANNAAKIVYLCTEAGGAITGQVISTTGWDMSLYSRRRPVKFVHSEGPWTVAELARLLPVSLAADEVNPAPPAGPRLGPGMQDTDRSAAAPGLVLAKGAPRWGTNTIPACPASDAFSPPGARFAIIGGGARRWTGLKRR